MRIISGNLKGKKLLEPKDTNTRPLKDLTKESIFNVLQHSKKFSIDFKKSEILDLFCGTGSFGIECLSREVKFVTFVENYDGILSILEKNLISLKNISNYKIIKKDILNNFNFNIFKKKFDIIFLDPPYKEDGLKELISTLISLKILSKNGLVIIHRHKKSEDVFPKSFKIFEERTYGISKIIFGTFY